LRPLSKNNSLTNASFSASFFRGSQAIISGLAFLIASSNAFPFTPPLWMKTTVVNPSGSVKYLVTSSLESSGRSCRSLIISARRSENSEGASASEISPSKASPAKIVVISAL
jgi:hypothetical protein